MSDRIDKFTSVQATLTRGFLGRLRGMLQDGIINEEPRGKDATGTLVVVCKGHLYEGTDLS